MGTDAYVGIDVAVAEGKRLPVCVCCWREGRLVPLPLKTPGQDAGAGAWMLPPEMPGNEGIPEDVASYQRDRSARKGLPQANRIWMLFGFDLFRVLSAEGWECLEVYPQATVRVIGAGERNKKSPGGVLGHLTAAAAHTRWPDPVSVEALRGIAFGSRDDCLDAYLAAWVAALDEADREPLGKPPHDAIWVPRVGAREVRAAGQGDGFQAWPLTRRFDEALVYATHLHEGTLRKGTAIPYVSHLLAVCARVLEDGGSEDEAISALLHDAVEDAGGEARLRAIRKRFGERVAAIVAGCSDSDQSPKPPWRGRKERYVRHLKTEADASTLRVSLADKLHNARAILRDHRAMGEAIWDRFNASAGDQLWYFEALLAVFRERSPGPMVDELGEVVAAIRELHARGPVVARNPMADRFRIVYEKLDEAVQQDGSVSVERIAIVSDELDEIAELRRLSAALAEPESRSHTLS